MNISFISDCVDGETPLDELEIISVARKAHARVDLCIKGPMHIPFAAIKLYDQDRFVCAQKAFPMAKALGEAIAKAFNERNAK